MPVRATSLVLLRHQAMNLVKGATGKHGDHQIATRRNAFHRHRSGHPRWFRGGLRSERIAAVEHLPQAAKNSRNGHISADWAWKPRVHKIAGPLTVTGVEVTTKNFLEVWEISYAFIT